MRATPRISPAGRRGGKGGRLRDLGEVAEEERRGRAAPSARWLEEAPGGEQEREEWRRKRTAPRRTARWRATGAREGEERVLEGIGERGRIGKD